MTNDVMENFLSPDIRAQMQAFYNLPLGGLTDQFLDEWLTLNDVEIDLREALKYPSLAQAARENRLKTKKMAGTGTRVGLYLTTRRWVWQAIELALVRPRWKD